MASSLFKSRLLDFSSPSVKLYGYKSISREEEKTLIERLCRPTMSLLQAQISTHANYQNQTETLDLSSVNYNAENIPVSLGDYASQVSTNLSIDTESQSVSSISSSRLVDLRSVNDYEKVADKLNKLVELWNRNSKVNKLSPPCACERGAVLLREDSEKWAKHNQSERSSRCSNILHHHQYNIDEPVDWEIVNRIVRRLHKSRIMLKMLAKRKMPNTPPPNSHPPESNHQFSNPGLQSNLFDSKGKFKPKQFINQWETLQVDNHLLNRISRPTTSSQLKRRIGCIICDAKPSAKTSLGVVNTYSKNDISYPITHCFHNKKEEIELVERVLQPTIASQADKCRCKRSYRFEPHPTTTITTARKISSQRSNSSTIELSGESIIHRVNNSNKQLPLISGLERSSSINSIVRRLYSGKCQRINCHVNKQVK
ncbi:unnamed protein product [Trichobilharzia regenti]|nr:unnamed protein product [Trichobilharzia regenti]